MTIGPYDYSTRSEAVIRKACGMALVGSWHSGHIRIVLRGDGSGFYGSEPITWNVVGKGELVLSDSADYQYRFTMESLDYDRLLFADSTMWLAC